MILNYKNYKHKILLENENNEKSNNNIDFNIIIDYAYKHFKTTKKPVNTLDIINFVENYIGTELDDNEYEYLYYKITGENINIDEIDDLEDEKKFIIN